MTAAGDTLSSIRSGLEGLKHQAPLDAALASALAGAGIARIGTTAGIRTLHPERSGDPEYARRVKQASLVLGALIGGLTPVLRDAELKQGFPEFWKSLTDRNYWEHRSIPHAGSTDGMSDPFTLNINKDEAFQLVSDDSFLRPYERRDILALVNQAPGKESTSQYGLVKSGLRAGVSFLPAYAFGRLVGRVLGLEKDTAKSMSELGALAFAARTSGIFGELSR